MKRIALSAVLLALPLGANAGYVNGYSVQKMANMWAHNKRVPKAAVSPDEAATIFEFGGYVRGVVDLAMARQILCIGHVQFNEIAQAVADYVEAHSDIRDRNGEDVVLDALKDKYSCPTPK